MKKVTSAALLALKLTWKLVLLFFFLTGGVQLFSVYQELMPGGVPLQTTFGFEHLIQTAVMPAGKYWMAFLAISLSVQASQSKGSKTVYTMNRLGLSETQVTLIFGAIFTGYFLLYWAFQLALAYGCFVWYSRFTLVSANSWMLACWRSEWLHTLLPLGEWWGYVRNAAICLSFGFVAAMGSTLARHGKRPLIITLPAMACALLLFGEIGVPVADLVLAGVLVILTVFCYFRMKEVLNDDDL